MITQVDLNTGQVTKRELTPEERSQLPVIDLEKENQERINREAREYLSQTDWYVIRLQEIGTPIPVDILQKRNDARASVVEV